MKKYTILLVLLISILAITGCQQGAVGGRYGSSQETPIINTNQAPQGTRGLTTEQKKEVITTIRDSCKSFGSIGDRDCNEICSSVNRICLMQFQEFQFNLSEKFVDRQPSPRGYTTDYINSHMTSPNECGSKNEIGGGVTRKYAPTTCICCSV